LPAPRRYTGSRSFHLPLKLPGRENTSVTNRACLTAEGPVGCTSTGRHRLPTMAHPPAGESTQPICTPSARLTAPRSPLCLTAALCVPLHRWELRGLWPQTSLCTACPSRTVRECPRFILLPATQSKLLSLLCRLLPREGVCLGWRACGREHTPSRVPQRWGTTSCREAAPLTYSLSLLPWACAGRPADEADVRPAGGQLPGQ
jgi:hypothetical protein